MAPRPELFPFRYRDPRTGLWIRARHVAELHEIKARGQQPAVKILASPRGRYAKAIPA
jgi:hypothetical protein